MSYITIGVISKPQGIKGEVKVTPLTDDNARFLSLKEVFIDGKNYNVGGCKVTPAGIFIALEGVNDRNQAEQFRGKDVKVDRKDAVKLDEDRHFIVDIIGCKLVADGKVFGQIKDVLQYGAADIYAAVTSDSKKVMFPALKDVITDIDIENKVVTVCMGRFNEVAVYED